MNKTNHKNHIPDLNKLMMKLKRERFFIWLTSVESKIK